MTALWTSAEIAEATGGTVSAPFEVTGVTFDSREVEPGFLFVAMPGTVADGHDFIGKALGLGAAAALVSRPVDCPHVLVPDVPAALEALARAARARMTGIVLGLTGSVGKTSTKEALAAALERRHRGKVHRSVKSYNNHTGVPLSLARMPRDSVYGVFEMGMNHAGEIRALTAMVRPHVALVTAIAPAHIENLGSMEAIADAKGEIFEGLEPGGTAIIPNDTPYRDRLLKKARRHAETILTFGSGDAEIHAVHAVRADNGGSLVTARLQGSDLTYTIAQPGEHWVSNSLAVLAAVEAAGADLAAAGLALGDMGGLKGRGERHHVPVRGGTALLIDESYNANPASMAATLRSLGEEPVEGRRLAVLGTMLELGDHSDEAHAGLAPAIREAKVAEVILVGEAMRPLLEALGADVPAVLVPDAAAATDALWQRLGPGDAVLVKGSNGIGLAKLVSQVAGGAATCST
ncbi:UDP-N-acetylmuramoyl-tripeptide--D-alanyl-D-alanine ligase [Sphingomonas astaxanthinifaciens]|uniref:UDP-N-acetylmuramoyl-tripeptide--D-alanyl-D-alanine ligase n=1 Tax=Sphingomonas astaxanthinifaciens DSM 22298 TaxID=1123267 RepID=A0ABQ5Z5F7_9SPHN|nr:UDP-N-acetylmuramoyl-tripeptide--D-alanyl-D-alanine ligase [Sphingomonas astaxanthinifaciens]GLR47209.1 UDP-N-acetylmuramoyl-tripeptide--D-alanyl-D-alanine ligase [Sphingomonas astaxanthinifaciens DSM 22298]